MAVKEFSVLQKVLICSMVTTVVWINFICFIDTKQWFKQDRFPSQKATYKFDQQRNMSKEGDKSDERRTVPVQALKRIDEYMNFTDLKDHLSLVNISTSLVTIRKKTSVVRVGDNVMIDIILFNGRGERTKNGGDMLRVWLREPDLNASVSGYVIDHGNGSYTGVVKAMWPGNPELMFSVANTKEHIGIFLNVVRRYGLSKFLQAFFKKGNLTESTLCSILPNIPNTAALCNFTNQNFNFSFFCGKPKELGCEDWKEYSRSAINSCNEKQKSLFMNYKYFKKRVGKLHISAGTTGEPNISCHDVSSALTWQTTNPTGYFFNNEWRSLLCKPSLSWRYKSYASCLKNRPVLLTGDSTTRNWYSPLAKLLKLHVFVGRHEVKDEAWQKFAEAVDKNNLLSIYWTPHEIPFFSYKQNKNNFRTVASRIDDLPGNQRAIIILHWFGHMTMTTPNHFREHVASAKHSVQRLLRRSPHSSILIKGPHSFTHKYYFLEPFDYLNRIYKQILYEEFIDLQEKVYFIDQWDATVGNENVDIHPKPFLNPIMANFAFSFIC